MPIECNRTEPPQLTDRGFAVRRLPRLLPLLVVIAVAGLVIAMGWHRHLSLETLLRHRATIDAFVAAHRVAAILALIVVYAAAVALSIPGAAVLTICAGVIFGGLTAGLAAIAAGTLGATIIFLVATAALRGLASDRAGALTTRRGGQVAERLAAGFRKDAFWYLVSLRLMPWFPFWLINLMAAPCGVALGTFIAATAIGIIPASFAYAFFGAGLDSSIAAQVSTYQACLATQRTDCRLDFNLMAAMTPQLIGGLVALGLVALIPPIVKRFISMRDAKGVGGTLG